MFADGCQTFYAMNSILGGWHLDVARKATVIPHGKQEQERMSGRERKRDLLRYAFRALSFIVGPEQ